MILANRFLYCMPLRAGCIILSVIALIVCCVHIYKFNATMQENAERSDSLIFPEGITQILLRLMPEFLTIIGVSFLLIALFLDFIHLILITLTFEVTQMLYQLLYSIIATTLNINVTVNLGVYSIVAYWCLIIGWIAFSAYFVYIIISYLPANFGNDPE
ncbi:uncharacterized protein LOC117895317 isoform X1 [Drosophila subobscura]|uniref:uncharacterized protein LOC117895317 isoform X1 n=1 Tax=Drosophila subobscura TaxID=7241 RepID=UPI00155ACA0F|nr:uncharacterized protein LOC117895317 isoform X1 [Drosophila subobscura]